MRNMPHAQMSFVTLFRSDPPRRINRKALHSPNVHYTAQCEAHMHTLLLQQSDKSANELEAVLGLTPSAVVALRPFGIVRRSAHPATSSWTPRPDPRTDFHSS